MMQVTDKDIKELDQLQLVKLCELLMICETRSFDIRAHAVDCTFNITTSDGGEDASAFWSGGVDETDYLFRDSLIQVKATRMPSSKCKDELLLEGKLKPKIEELFKRGGTYILFCNTDANGDRAIALKSAATGQGYPQASAKSYHPSKIAAWTNKYFAAVRLVKEFCGKTLPVGVQGWSRWSRYREHLLTEFVIDDTLEHHITQIRQCVSSQSGVMRISGLSGLGKSRLTIESLSHADFKDQVCIIDAGGSSEGLFTNLTGWLQSNPDGILVVDNCSSALHRQLAIIAGHADSKLSLVTLSSDPDEVPNWQKYIELQPLAKKTIESLIRKKYPDLPAESVDTIANFAEGFPKMAVLMCAADLRQSGVLSSLTPPDMVNQLLFAGGVVDQNALKVISVCSLFDKFAFDDGKAGETACIVERLCSGLSLEDFCSYAMKFKKRNILEPHMGAFTKVTPRPLAWRLASDWWESCSETLADLLLDKEWPLSLAEAMCNQLVFLKETKAAHKVADKLCSPSCPFASAESLSSSRGSRLFCALCEVNPAVALVCLERAFLKKSDDELRQIAKGRRYLVWALEKLCWNSENFLRAGFVMALFAAAENENRISNNATGQLKKLFHIYLPGTQAMLNQRIELLDSLAEVVPDNLLIDCLCSGFSYGNFNRVRGVESQGGKLPEKDYEPTGKEIHEYWSELLKRLLPFLESAQHKSKILEHAARMFLYLVRFDMVDLVDQILEAQRAFDSQFWPEGLEELAFALREEASRLSAQSAVRIEKLIEALKPNTFSQKYVLLVGQPSYSNIEVDENGKHVSGNIKAAIMFGEENGAIWPEWKDELGTALSGEQRESNSFAKGLYRTLLNPTNFINSCLTYLKIHGKSCNPSLLGNFLAESAENNAKYLSGVVDELESQAFDIPYIPWLILRAGLNDATLERFQRLLLVKAMDTSELSMLKFGGVIKNVTANALDQFLRWLISYDTTYTTKAICLELVHMYCLNDERQKDFFKPLVREIVITPGLMKSLRGLSFHDWQESVRDMLVTGDRELAVVVAEMILDLCSGNDEDALHEFDTPLQPILTILFQSYFADIWKVFGPALAQESLNMDDYLLMSNLLLLFTNKINNMFESNEQPIAKAPPSALASWFVAHPKIAFRMIRDMRLWETDQNDEIAPSTLFSDLLSGFGGNADFLRSVELNLASVGGKGSLRPEYEKRLNFVRKISAAGNINVKQWAAIVEPYYEKRIVEARKREEEASHGIFEGYSRNDL